MSTMCKVCRLEFLSKESSLWCKIPNCPCTPQRAPTHEQVVRFQVGRKFENPDMIPIKPRGNQS